MNKYETHLRYRIAQAQRALLRGVLRWLCSWSPLDDPRPGYTVITGCVADLPEVLHANLAMLRRQQREHLHEVLIVVDRPRAALGADFEATLRQRFPDLPLRCLYYTPRQARTLRVIRWAWCYSWLSWCIGIAACRTRYALLHDLDALLLHRDLLEQRYHAIRQRGCEYLGGKFYNGNGVVSDDRLAVTFELMFDVPFVRRTFRPTDLFNHVGRIGSRRVEFDTFLHAQTRRGRSEIERIDARDMVHPSQVFCQYTAFRTSPRYVPPEKNNLLMLPYLFHVGGDERTLREHTEALRRSDDGRAALFGWPLDVSQLSRHHLDWLVEQATRVERAVAGHVRPEVADYFEALGALLDRRDAAGGARRVRLHGVAFDAITEQACIDRVMAALARGEGGWIVTPNLDHLRRAQRDATFRAMLDEADLVVADGMPLIWASRLQGAPLPERVAGSSMAWTVAAAAAEHGRSLFLLGGEPGVGEEAERKLTGRYPGLRVAGRFCPSMGFETDTEQMEELRSALRVAQPDIVYVALGSPKQERVIQALRSELPEAWWIGVGISLSFVAGRVKRAPVWVQRLGLEWVHRLVQEPRRLARRYLVDGLPFACRLLGAAAVRRMRGEHGESAAPAPRPRETARADQAAQTGE
ncbi:MAG: WecB/TagA/CpsF family glycosyltransferase [Phycisphaeraceae bacterium]